DVRVGGFLETAVQPAEAHVGQVLQPLEVRNRDPACIEVDVGYDEDTAPEQDLAGIRGDGSVRRFRHDTRADPAYVLQRDLILQGGRDQDVAVQLQRLGRPLDVLGAGEPEDRAGLAPVPDDLVHIQPV